MEVHVRIGTTRKPFQALVCIRRGVLRPASGLLLRDGKAAEASTAMTRLGESMAAAAKRSLSDDAAEAAKRYILTTLAVMISGAALPPGQTAMKFARIHALSDAPMNGCTVVGSNVLCGPMDAALANGMLAHSPACAESQPGCSVVAAALAAGELFAGDGVGFLQAVALGYDVASTHSMASGFGAAAAAGCMAGLDTRQMRWLLKYASQQASGITAGGRDADPIEKSLVWGGFPARNGVSAAVLAQLSGTGVDGYFLQALAAGVDFANQPGELRDATGTNATTREEVVTKSRERMAPVLGPQQTTELIDAILNLENVTSIRDLRPLLQR